MGEFCGHFGGAARQQAPTDCRRTSKKTPLGQKRRNNNREVRVLASLVVSASPVETIIQFPEVFIK